MNIKTTGEIALEREILTNLTLLADVLKVAMDNRFMSPDHAANIWKENLKLSSFDVLKRKGGDESNVS